MGNSYLQVLGTYVSLSCEELLNIILSGIEDRGELGRHLDFVVVES